MMHEFSKDLLAVDADGHLTESNLGPGTVLTEADVSCAHCHVALTAAHHGTHWTVADHECGSDRAA